MQLSLKVAGIVVPPSINRPPNVNKGLRQLPVIGLEDGELPIGVSQQFVNYGLKGTYFAIAFEGFDRALDDANLLSFPIRATKTMTELTEPCYCEFRCIRRSVGYP